MSGHASTGTDSWAARGFRGFVVRAAVCTPLAALLGATESWPQALYTAGLCLGLLAALTFGERWLTRSGPTTPWIALGGALLACVLVAATTLLLMLQFESNFGQLAWESGPAPALKALFESGIREGAERFAVFLLLSLPVAVATFSYLQARQKNKIVAQSVWTALAVGGALSLGAMCLHPTIPGTVLAFAAAAWTLVGSLVVLFALLFLGDLEATVWSGRPTRWADPPGPEELTPLDPGA